MIPGRRANRRRREPRKLPLPALPWWPIAATVAGVAVLGLAWFAVRSILDRPLRAVVVNGAFERVSADRLEAQLRQHMGRSFLGADLNAIQAEIAGIPWVATARVSRRWPDAVEVTITEERPAARWGQAGLLNAAGRLIVADATHLPAELPRLAGPPGTEAEVATRYAAIQEQMVQRGMGLAALELDGRGAWTFQLSNGIRVRLGSTALEERLAAFYKAFDTVVAGQAEDVEYVDLRYPNGFAVGWKNQRGTDAVLAAGVTGAKEG